VSFVGRWTVTEAVFVLQSLDLLVRCWRTVVVTECLMGFRFGFGYLFDLWGLGVVEQLAD
jgi:hypothetical protein